MSGNNDNDPIYNLAGDMPGLGLYDDLTDLGGDMPFLNGGMPGLHGGMPDPNPSVQQGPGEGMVPTGVYPGNVSRVPLGDLPLQQLQQRPLSDMALFFNSLANQDPFANGDPFAQNLAGDANLGFVPAVPNRADSASSGAAAAPGINLQEMIQQEVQQQVRAQVQQQVQQELLNMGVVQAHPPTEQFGNVAERAGDSLVSLRNRAPSVAIADTHSSSELGFNGFQPDFLGGLGAISSQDLAQATGPASTAAFPNQGDQDVMLGAPGSDLFGDIGLQAPLDAGGFQDMHPIPTLDFSLNLDLDVDALGNLVPIGGAAAPGAALGDVGNPLGGSALSAAAVEPPSAGEQASINAPAANDPLLELDADFMAQLDEFLAGDADPLAGYAGDNGDDMFDNAVAAAAAHNAADEDREDLAQRSQGLRRSARVRERRERTPARRSASPALSHDGNDGNNDDDDGDDNGDNDRAASDNSDRVRYRRQMAKHVRIGPRPGADLLAYVDRVETGSCVDCGQDLSAVAGNSGICNACRTERLKFYGWRTWRRRANAHNRGAAADDDGEEEADRAEETWRRAPAFRLPGVTKAVYVARLGAGQCVDCGGHGRLTFTALCSECRKKRTSRYNRQTYLERKEKQRTASAGGSSSVGVGNNNNDHNNNGPTTPAVRAIRKTWGRRNPALAQMGQPENRPLPTAETATSFFPEPPPGTLDATGYWYRIDNCLCILCAHPARTRLAAYCADCATKRRRHSSRVTKRGNDWADGSDGDAEAGGNDGAAPAV